MIAVDEATDAELVEMVKADRLTATRPFDVLVRRYQEFVVANCRHITRSASDAEDLAQEVFVKVFFALRGFEERAKFKGWLYRVKVNHCLNHLRKNRGVTMLDLDDVAIAGHPATSVPSGAEERLEAGEQADLIARVLDRMSDTVRIPLVLRDADGLSYEEIADELGIGLSAVKMRIKRGREEFRRLTAVLSGGPVVTAATGGTA